MVASPHALLTSSASSLRGRMAIPGQMLAFMDVFSYIVALSIACVLRCLFGSDPVVALTLMHAIFIFSPLNFSGGLGLYPGGSKWSPDPYWKFWTARLMVTGWDDDCRTREAMTWRIFWRNTPRNGALLLSTGLCWIVFYKFALPYVTCDFLVSEAIACDRVLEGNLGSWVWWIGVVYYSTAHTCTWGACHSLYILHAARRNANS